MDRGKKEAKTNACANKSTIIIDYSKLSFSFTAIRTLWKAGTRVAQFATYVKDVMMLT